MKIEIFLNHSFISIILIIISPIPGNSKDCDNHHLFNFGLKPFCELSDGSPISCFGSLNDVKKAYIQCENGYFQKENIAQQVLECRENGEWSNQLITCSPECIEPPNEFELLDVNNKELPIWYVDVIRKVPEKGRVSRIPGMIFFEREILILEKDAGDFGFSSQFSGEYFIRMYENKTNFQDLTIREIHCKKWRSELGEYCILQMPFDEYIKFTENRKPICADNPKFQNFYDNTNGRRNRRLPKYTGDCIVPQISDPKLEIICFRDNPNYSYVRNRNTTNARIPTDCRKTTAFVIIRCKLGYQYKKPIQIDTLRSCVLNSWSNREDNGCELLCGQIDKNYRPFQTPLIYKGEKTDITTTPWHVGIFANHTILSNTYEQVCGGTIIHTNIVISAAHCFYDEANAKIYDELNYLVGAGKNFRNYRALEKDSYFVQLKKIHVTENYQSTHTLNDIAILVLKEHFIYSAHIKPVCIDFSQYHDYNIKNGIKGHITGWGHTSQNGDSSNDLLTTSLTTITNDQCKDLVNPNLRSQIIGDKFCAINDNNATACQGDSGGGFIVKKTIDNEDRYYLTGIVSVGIDRTKYCSDGFLTLFTNIQFYQNFITDVISEERNTYFY